MADSNEAWIDGTIKWSLLAEFQMTGLSQNKQSIKTRIMEAIQFLNIQPQQMGRICEVTVNALVNLAESTKTPDLPLILHHRIWSATTNVDSRSWGFFLVEKSASEFLYPDGAPTYFVDLFLYQEHGPGQEGY